MTARVFRLPVPARKRSPRETARLDAATEWLLSEVAQPPMISAMRELAWRELEAPRSQEHVIWATTFLNETEEFDRALKGFDRARNRMSDKR